MNEKIAAVVIPVYKNKLTPYELISLTRCCDVLKDYPKILVAPDNLDLSEYYKICKSFGEKRFERRFFEGFRGYNRLMLSKYFYNTFSDYEYILIHQPDVFIFRDELKEWCLKDYDYIGAPWLRDTIKIFLNVAKKNSLVRAVKLVKSKNLKYTVGNGGLSLRKISSFIECLNIEEQLVDSWSFNEDYFWSFFSRTHENNFKIPDYKEAVNFAIEKNPAECYKINNYQLPFGVHAWERWDFKFWKPFIEKYGFQLS